MTTNSDWWDKYKEEPYHKQGPVTMDIDCPEQLERPIGFVRLRERVRVKVVGRKWELEK